MASLLGAPAIALAAKPSEQYEAIVAAFLLDGRIVNRQAWAVANGCDASKYDGASMEMYRAKCEDPLEAASRHASEVIGPRMLREAKIKAGFYG